MPNEAAAPVVQASLPLTTPAAPAAAPVVASAITDGAAAAPAADAAPTSIVGDAAAPAKIDPTVDDMRKFVTEKGDKDVAKLDDAALKARYAELNKPAPVPLTAEQKAELVKGVEIKLPDGVTIDDATLNSFKELVVDPNLSPAERAQKMVDMHLAALKDTQEAPMKAWKSMQDDWVAQVKADKEMGGDNFKPMTITIAKAIEAFGGDAASIADTKQAFALTGAGNHPKIVGLLYRMGKALAENGPVSGAAPSSIKDASALLASMYPSATAKAG